MGVHDFPPFSVWRSTGAHSPVPHDADPSTHPTWVETNETDAASNLARRPDAGRAADVVPAEVGTRPVVVGRGVVDRASFAAPPAHGVTITRARAVAAARMGRRMATMVAGPLAEHPRDYRRAAAGALSPGAVPAGFAPFAPSGTGRSDPSGSGESAWT